MIFISTVTLALSIIALKNKWQLPLAATPSLYWFFTVFTATLLFRIPFLVNIETDVDTSTWIASAISIDYYPDKLWKWLTYTDSRPLTVLPVYLMLKSGLPVNYITTEILALLMWLLICYINYRTLSYMIPKMTAFILCSCAAIFIGSCNTSDFTAYNSEFISILMLSVATFMAVKQYYQGLSSKAVIGVGFLLGSLLYAKFQNVPMGLVITAFMAIQLMQNKQYRLLTGFILAGITPTLLINLYYYSKGAIDQFWVNYLFNYFEYSFTTHFQSLSLWKRFHPEKIGRFILHYYQSRVFFIALFFAILWGIIYLFRKKQNYKATKSSLLVFCLLLTLSSLYAILQSGNSFGHYQLYLLFPLIFMIAALGKLISDSNFSLLISIVAIGTIGQIFTNILYSHNRLPAETTRFDKEIVNIITQNSTSTDNMVIWGWIDRLHYLSQRACGYAMVHTHHLFLHNSKLFHIREQLFLDDLDNNKPAIFVEDTKGLHSPLPYMFRKMDQYPVIKEYIDLNYTLLENIDGISIYKRN